MANSRWHHGTRFWKLAGETVLLLFLALFACIIWKPDLVGEISTIMTITLPVIFGGSSLVKHQEKKNGK